jgi:hypothetical protein
MAEGLVETTGWEGERVLVVPGKSVWHTKLHEDHFERCRDRRTYA